jgi:hypothetical protein
MTPKNIREMEPHIRQRYWFASSSFSRMLGVKTTMNDMHIRQFCIDWSHWAVHAPLSGLDEADQYFYYEYKNWRGR